jgi:hypothetical protein
MKRMWIAMMLLSGSFLLAQDSTPDSTHTDANDSNGEITVQGCVTRSGGDFTLVKQDPAITYQLQGSHKIRLGHYLGQRVELTGSKSATLATSSDSINGRTGSAAPVTLTVSSIRTINKTCTEAPAADK